MDRSTRNALIAWASAVVVFGIVLIGGAVPGADAPVLALYALLGQAILVPDPALRFSIGLMGAVTLGWGLSVLAVASASHLLDAGVARTLWRRIAAAIAAWYVVDGMISVETGFALNVVPNTLLLGAFLLIAARGGLLARDASDVARA